MAEEMRKGGVFLAFLTNMGLLLKPFYQSAHISYQQLGLTSRNLAIPYVSLGTGTYTFWC